jgi:hypothetical protein
MSNTISVKKLERVANKGSRIFVKDWDYRKDGKNGYSNQIYRTKRVDITGLFNGNDGVFDAFLEEISEHANIKTIKLKDYLKNSNYKYDKFETVTADDAIISALNKRKDYLFKRLYFENEILPMQKALFIREQHDFDSYISCLEKGTDFISEPIDLSIYFVAILGNVMDLANYDNNLLIGIKTSINNYEEKDVKSLIMQDKGFVKSLHDNKLIASEHILDREISVRKIPWTHEAETVFLGKEIPNLVEIVRETNIIYK